MSPVLPLVALLALGYALTKRQEQKRAEYAPAPVQQVGVRSSDPIAEGRAQARAVSEATMMGLFTAPYAMMKTMAAQKGLTVRPPQVVSSEAVGGPDTYTVFLSMQFDTLKGNLVVSQTKATTLKVQGGKVVAIDGKPLPVAA